MIDTLEKYLTEVRIEMDKVSKIIPEGVDVWLPKLNLKIIDDLGFYDSQWTIIGIPETEIQRFFEGYEIKYPEHIHSSGGIASFVSSHKDKSKFLMHSNTPEGTTLFDSLNAQLRTLEDIHKRAKKDKVLCIHYRHLDIDTPDIEFGRYEP